MDASEIEAQDLHDKKMARLARERAELQRLRAIETAARTYYHNYCQDEANEEGVCGLAQQLDAIALRDALAVGQSS